MNRVFLFVPTMKSRNIVKTSFFTLFVLICFIQCYTIMRSFLQYPYLMNTYDVSPNLIKILPGLTVCNNNRISLKKLVKKMPNIGRALDRRVPPWRKLRFMSDGDLNDFRDEFFKIMEQLNFVPQELLDNSTVDETFNLKPDPSSFFKSVACAHSWNDTIECESLSRIDSLQDRICSTFLHKGAVHYDIENKPYIFNSSRRNETDQVYFSGREVIKLIIDFEPEDYADLKRQIGARIMIHDTNYVASAIEPDFFVTRGYKYDFNIAREEIILNEPKCINYEDLNIDQYHYEIDPRVPLSGETCFQNCVTRRIIRLSKCWPSTMPYYRNESLDSNRNMKACGWFRQAQYLMVYREILRLQKMRGSNKSVDSKESELEKSYKRELKHDMKAYAKIRRHCWRRCKPLCRVIEYSVSVTRSPWPSDVQVLVENSIRDRVLRHCCALISIKYSHFHYNVQVFTPKYNLVDIIGNIGGLLAVWIGFSMVSVYHGLQKLVKFINERHGSKVSVEGGHH